MLEGTATYRQLIVCKKTASEVVVCDNFDEAQQMRGHCRSICICAALDSLDCRGSRNGAEVRPVS